jgi:hypothetical protein
LNKPVPGNRTLGVAVALGTPTVGDICDATVSWPPNHRFWTITAHITASDVCDGAPAVRLVSITSNQPVDGRGDGHTSPDVRGAAFGTDDRGFQLRAERRGARTRIYTITYEAQDDHGNVTTRQAFVQVPGNRGH